MSARLTFFGLNELMHGCRLSAPVAADSAGGVVNVSLRNAQKVSPPLFSGLLAMDKFHRGQTDIKFQTRLHPMWEDCCG